MSKKSKKYLFLVLEVFFPINPISPSENKLFSKILSFLKNFRKARTNLALGLSACD
jgi:hypothetical protein